jgi:hypothetical protein
MKTSKETSKISTTIDFGVMGRDLEHLVVAYSTNQSARQLPPKIMEVIDG